MRNEEKAVKLFGGVTGIGDDLIEEAGTARVRKKISEWKRELVAGLCLIALAGVGVWRWMGRFDGPITPDLSPAAVSGPAADDPAPDQLPPDNCDIPGAAGASRLPGGITPVLRVGGTLYEWTGLAQRVFLDDGGSYSIMGTSDTYLPEGYEPCGEIGGVTAEEPAEDFQLQAGFEAAGTVFVSEGHPAVVYALMTTDWLEGSYVRFVSEALGDNELVTWQGRMYRFSLFAERSEVVEELPEGCELIGNLHFVGYDAIPTEDFETNCRGDCYAKPLEGREVYAVPGDDSVLYVYEHHYWAQGDYPAWRECHLWER